MQILPREQHAKIHRYLKEVTLTKKLTSTEKDNVSILHDSLEARKKASIDFRTWNAPCSRRRP